MLLGARFVISRKRGYFAPLEMGDDSANAKAPLLTTSTGEVAPSQGARARPPGDFALLLSHAALPARRPLRAHREQLEVWRVSMLNTLAHGT